MFYCVFLVPPRGRRGRRGARFISTAMYRVTLTPALYWRRRRLVVPSVRRILGMAEHEEHRAAGIEEGKKGRPA